MSGYEEFAGAEERLAGDTLKMFSAIADSYEKNNISLSKGERDLFAAFLSGDCKQEKFVELGTPARERAEKVLKRA